MNLTKIHYQRQCGGGGGGGGGGGVQMSTKEEQTATAILVLKRLSVWLYYYYYIYLIETKGQQSGRLLPIHPCSIDTLSWDLYRSDKTGVLYGYYYQ